MAEDGSKLAEGAKCGWKLWCEVMERKWLCKRGLNQFQRHMLLSHAEILPHLKIDLGIPRCSGQEILAIEVLCTK